MRKIGFLIAFTLFVALVWGLAEFTPESNVAVVRAQSIIQAATIITALLALFRPWRRL